MEPVPLERTFEWDDDKRVEVISARGVDFLDAILIFQGDVLTRRDDRHDYGEERFISIGTAGEHCYVVVHTERGGVTRIISAWQGGRRERAKYQARHAVRNSTNEGTR